MMQFKKYSLTILLLLLASGVSAQDGNPDKCMKKLSVPTAFSPNGDGNNDVLSVYVTCIPEAFEMTIYDSWGTAIFQSSDYLFKWNGEDSTATKQASGVYVYTLNITYGGTVYTRSGSVTLLR